MAHRDNDDDASRQIDANLRRVYQEMLDEEVPDRFKTLLAQLEAKTAGSENESADNGHRDA
ncbi:NepR family anti-sigma factor [Pseudooceanicola sp.]|uniref:NepR family anti-sigma factor n=1 Tax=Pseudooceanicola sp. TaxID=1914328 RepID=UPI0035C7790C